jgi:hypothetical protein
MSWRKMVSYFEPEFRGGITARIYIKIIGRENALNDSRGTLHACARDILAERFSFIL